MAGDEESTNPLVRGTTRGLGLGESSILEKLPLAVFVEDLSALKEHLADLERCGVADLAAHFEASPEELHECLEKVRIIGVNAAALRLYEAQSEEELLADLARILGPEALQKFLGGILELSSGSVAFEFEARNHTLGGRELDVVLHFALLPEHVEDWSRLLVVAADITEHTSMKRAAEQMAQRYRGLVEDQPELMCRFLPDGELTFVNRAYAAYFGKSLEECTGLDLFALVPARAQDGLRAHFASFSPSRPVSRVEHEVIKPDGSIGWMQWTNRAILDKDAETIVEFQSIGVDITERKAMELQLKASEQRFREISEHIREVFWLFDWEENRVLYVSPRFEAVWGRSAQTLYDDHGVWVESILPEDRQYAQETFQEISETGGGEAREYRIRRGDGEVRWISDRGFAVRDDEGKVVRIAGIAEDITDGKRIEAERRQLEAQVRAAQKLESLGLMAGGVAHDFNNLLMGVLGNADLALAALPATSPARQPLENIETTARRAAELANQMLAYSGRGRFVVDTVDLSRLVEEMSRLARVSVSKKTTLNFDLDRVLPGIEVDVTQVRQVVLNLITNASEAIGGQTGVISIRTGCMHCNGSYLRGVVAGERLEPGDFVYVEVADTGSGMSEEVQKRIFDPFFTTKFTGRGLGMAAVLGIARGHGGAVHVVSSAGEGTSIKILFPATSKPAVEEPVQAATELQWVGEGRVLLVDDEPVVRGVAQRMLEHFGFDVVVAEDGLEGVRAFRHGQDRIRLVILDMEMPGLRGEEALLEIKGIRSDVPVLMSSGYDEQDVGAASFAESLAGYIQKPYRLAALKDAVREALGED